MNVVGFGSRAIPWNRKDCGNQGFRGLLRFWEGYGLKAQTLYRVECLNGASCFRSRKTWNNHQRFQKVTGNCFPRSQSRSNHINFDSLSKQQHSRNILTYYNISKNPIYQHPSRNQNRPKVIQSISLPTTMQEQAEKYWWLFEQQVPLQGRMLEPFRYIIGFKLHFEPSPKFKLLKNY